MGTLRRQYRVNVHKIPNWNGRNKDILQWCRDNCGDQWTDWSYQSWEFRFRFKKTYSNFLLRWL